MHEITIYGKINHDSEGNWEGVYSNIWREGSERRSVIIKMLFQKLTIV